MVKTKLAPPSLHRPSLLLWLLYTIRLRQFTAQVKARLYERLAERTRIARELHDTLLQSFQGLLLLFQRARNLLPERLAEAIQLWTQRWMERSRRL